MKSEQRPHHLSPRAVTRYGEQGPWLVALHSSMSSRRQWQRLGDMLRHDHRVLAIDLLGYGDAPRPPAASPFTLAVEAARIRALLPTWIAADDPLHLLGHSYGGAVALQLAVELADRVDSITLYEPTAFHLLPGEHPALQPPREIATMVTQLARESDAREAQLIATELFVDFWSGAGSFAALDEAKQLRLSSQVRKVALDFQALFEPSYPTAQLAQIAAPACLITGRNSPDCVHQILAVLADHLPAHELRCIAAGHMAPVTHPDLVNPLVQAFLREQRAGSRRVERARAPV